MKSELSSSFFTFAQRRTYSWCLQDTVVCGRLEADTEVVDVATTAGVVDIL